MYMKAKIMIAKRKLGSCILELQDKNLEERMVIHQTIQKLDKDLFGA